MASCSFRGLSRRFWSLGLTLGGLITLIGLGAAPASAKNIKDLPATPPLVIDQPGHYVVTRDLVSSGSAILISANDVVLDLHGHTISGPGSGVGIWVQNASGVTVENGVITGFGYGIYLDHSSNCTVAGNTANGNSDPVSGVGIFLDHSTNTTVVGNTASGNNSYGLLLYGSINNTLTGNTANGNSNPAAGVLTAGIAFFHGGSGNTLTRNTANGNVFCGILLSDTTSNTVNSNTATGNFTADLFDGNVNCDSNTWTNNTFGTRNQACIN